VAAEGLFLQLDVRRMSAATGAVSSAVTEALERGPTYETTVVGFEHIIAPCMVEQMENHNGIYPYLLKRVELLWHNAGFRTSCHPGGFPRL
jgi:hypothetical protein